MYLIYCLLSRDKRQRLRAKNFILPWLTLDYSGNLNVDTEKFLNKKMEMTKVAFIEV